jgi:hypothetical protein
MYVVTILTAGCYDAQSENRKSWRE